MAVKPSRRRGDGPAASLFSDPVQGVYSRTVTVGIPLGQPIKIGAPFGIPLDTADF